MIHACMVMVLLATQDSGTSRFNLLNDEDLPEFLVTDDQDKKQEPKEQTIVSRADKRQDELPVGDYRRPMWTLHRVSPQSRIYLQVDAGEVEFEQWLDIRISKARNPSNDIVRMSEEF